MRLIVSIMFLGFLASTAAEAWADEGREVFTKLNCAMCHKPDKKTAAVSLKEIARAYSDEGKLVSFFKGELKPLIESDNWGMMRSQLDKIKALPDEDKKALADYILSFK
jgi:cytochrome c